MTPAAEPPPDRAAFPSWFHVPAPGDHVAFPWEADA